jgi:uncharacterized protein (TIGR02300 family)
MVDLTKYGKRWICVKCDARFYDLNKPEPICPKCGHNQLLSTAEEEDLFLEEEETEEELPEVEEEKEGEFEEGESEEEVEEEGGEEF